MSASKTDGWTDAKAKNCKFGSKCTRGKKCPFVHKPVKKISHKKKIPCRDGKKCTRDDCFFDHPVDETQIFSALFPCRNGDNCTKEKCNFGHKSKKEVSLPSEEKKEEVQPTRKKEDILAERLKHCVLKPQPKACEPRTDVLCFHGPTCKKLNCPFTHPPERIVFLTDASKQLCYHEVRDGACPYEKTCAFAHGTGQIKGLIKTCLAFYRGECLDDKCPYDHVGKDGFVQYWEENGVEGDWADMMSAEDALHPPVFLVSRE